MKLVLSLKTKRHHWKWDIGRMLEVLSYLLVTIMMWWLLVMLMCIGSNVAWM